MSNLLPVCFYHEECTDGYAAALAVWVFHNHGDVILWPVNYNKPFTYPWAELAGRDVYMVDFTYNDLDLMLDIYEASKSFTIFDHHKGAKPVLDYLELYSQYLSRVKTAPPLQIVFDQKKSGATIAWETLFPNPNDIPETIRYIEDFDTWRKQYPETEVIASLLKWTPKDPETWLKLFTDFSIEELVQQGVVVERTERAITEATIRQTHRLVKFKGHIVPYIACIKGLHSNAGDMINENYPFSVSYVDFPHCVEFSLRSRGFDVLSIAKEMGGGGHPTAAGFPLPHDQVSKHFEVIE